MKHVILAAVLACCVIPVSADDSDFSAHLHAKFQVSAWIDGGMKCK